MKGERDRILGFGKKDKIHLRAWPTTCSHREIHRTAVRFRKGLLAVDTDGDSAADLAVNLPGITSLKGSNLIL